MKFGMFEEKIQGAILGIYSVKLECEGVVFQHWDDTVIILRMLPNSKTTRKLLSISKFMVFTNISWVLIVWKVYNIILP